MTAHKRRRIFYGLFAAFFVLGTGAILYVSGWRFDLATLRIKKVGAIYVRSFPKEAKIYLDNRLVKNNSGFFQNGTLIDNLFPKNYKLKLVFDNYKTWQENISVLPSFVSEAKYAVLIPKDSVTVATGTVSDFWLLGENVLVQDEKGLFLAGEKIGVGKVLGWTDDYQNILILDDKTNSYILYNAGNDTRTNISSLLKKFGFGSKRKFKILIDPADKRNLIIAEPRRISLLNVEEPRLTTVKQIYRGSFGEKIAATQFLLVWTEFNETQNASAIIIYDRFLRKNRAATSDLKGKNLDIRIVSDGKLALLQDNGGMYTYDLQKNDLNKIADDVKDFEFASDGSAVAALENNSLEVIPLDQNSEYRRFNLPNVRSAEKVIWYRDASHLFVAYADYTAFLDVNNASLDNFMTVTKTNFVKYDEKNNRLYFLENGGLKKFDFPR